MGETKSHPEQLLSTKRVARRLSLNRFDVLRLIRKGELNAVTQRSRGTGKRPRKYVLESELVRYIRTRPAAQVTRGPDDPAKPLTPVKLAKLRGRVSEELESAKVYY